MTAMLGSDNCLYARLWQQSTFGARSCKPCCHWTRRHSWSRPSAARAFLDTAREQHQQHRGWREIPGAKIAAGLASCLVCLSGTSALAFDIPFLPGGPPLPPSTAEERAKAFEESDFLRNLRERTAANRAKNKRELEDKYCYRQAELGVGDCAGLRLIPGATKSGKQKTPEWLRNVLGGSKQNSEQAEQKSETQEAVPLADEE